MATYTELQGVAASNALLAKITAAVAIQADAIRTESGATANHANRLIWAKQAFVNPAAIAAQMTWALLAQNQSAPLANITGATDAAILAAVAAAVDIFATGA